MWKDLKSEETKKEAAKAEEEPKAKKARLEPGQQTLFHQINKFTKVDPQGAIQQKFDKLLLELVGCNFIPFNIIDSQEFHAFVNYLNKTFNIKTGSTYGKQMSKYSAELLDDVIKMLKEF